MWHFNTPEVLIVVPNVKIIQPELSWYRYTMNTVSTGEEAKAHKDSNVPKVTELVSKSTGMHSEKA